MENGQIDDAKAQVQGQLAAQYIQDVMQARREAVRVGTRWNHRVLGAYTRMWPSGHR